MKDSCKVGYPSIDNEVAWKSQLFTILLYLKSLIWPKLTYLITVEIYLTYFGRRRCRHSRGEQFMILRNCLLKLLSD